jgi:hypothetical protein
MNQSMYLPHEKAFPLPENPPAWQDEKRTLMCLLKMKPLETTEQFAERVWREWQKAEQRLKAKRQKPNYQ